jgi:nucleotide-binding universal stress UspA family protein
MITVRKILVPVDFGDTCGRVLDFARLIADACGASLQLLHVIEYPLAHPEAMRQQRRDTCRRLSTLFDTRDRDHRQARAICEVGTPAHEIVRYAQDHAIDLIVMGTHSHGPTFQMATASIADIVVGAAPCAVLAVKGVGRVPDAACEPFALTSSP